MTWTPEPRRSCRPLVRGTPNSTSCYLQAFNTYGIVYDNTPWRPGREMDLVDRPVSEEDERKLKNLATRIMSNGVEVLVKDKSADTKQEQTKYMEVKTIQPSAPSNMFVSNYPKIDKRIDNDEDSNSFDLIQPSEPGHVPCTSSCSCSHTKTEGLKTKYTNMDHSLSAATKYGTKTSKYGATKIDLRPTKLESIDKKTQYGPYEYEGSQMAPTDRIVEKYTEVINDYSDEKDSNSVEATELLTNEQGPTPPKTNKVTNNKNPDKIKPEKPQKPNKNKVLVADLLKLGSLGIKGLSQLAPVLEKMTGGFMKRQEPNKTTTSTTSTTMKSVKLTPYHVNKRIDNDMESKQSNFPIYIPVDELETSESQIMYTNATLHQNLAWAAEHKQSNARIVPPRMIHESPLVNGGIPISPGEIITANSDVIVGKPAVGGPLTLAASGFNLHNPVNPPPIDSFVSGNEHYVVKEKPDPSEHTRLTTQVDDSFDLRPPEIPKQKPKPNKNLSRPTPSYGHQNSQQVNNNYPRLPSSDYRPSSSDYRPPSSDYRPSSSDHRPTSLDYRPTSSDHRPTSSDHRPTSSDHRPTSSDHRPTSSDHRPTSSDHRPTSSDHRPTYSDQRPSPTDHMMKTEHMKSTSVVLGNHGRPAFLDYIPSFGTPNNIPLKQHIHFKPEENDDEEIPDNSPSSSEIVNTRVTTNGDYSPGNTEQINKPFLVDIQPSRVANVLIPHGSATALVFAGSSEPHKTGDYIDDPLPYPEPGYFGSFSIDAPQMTNVHNVAPNNNNKQFLSKPVRPQESYKPNTSPPFKDPSYRNDLKSKWKENKRPTDYNKLPPPTSNQETHVQVGPQITAYNPDVYNPNNGDFEKYKNVRGNNNNNNYKDGKDVIDKEYENYLAVPPPPPKMHFNQDSHYDKNKHYNQKPIVHMKPVQDMKVFLNIQHPVPETPKPEPLPPKVTSEIYFAAQAPNSKPTPTYTIHIPPAAPTYGNHYNQAPNNNNQHHIVQNTNNEQISNSFTVVSSPNFSKKPLFTNDVNNKDNTYTVTLNTATNVAETGQVIGSSVPVAIGTSSNVGQFNTDIPIGTNFAIKVQDEPSPGPSSIESYTIQSNRNPPVVYDEHGLAPVEVSVGDNRWNKSTSEDHAPKYVTTIIGQHYYNQNYHDTSSVKANANPSIPPSLNSHANFPMLNDYTTPSNAYEDVKPVTENVEEVKTHDQRRPAKLIPNIPTNSHGWYSSGLLNENALNNIKVEVTTRKSIPLLHDYNKDSVPDFGQKITSIGKPPSGVWSQNTPTINNNQNIGKPFTKPVSTKKPSSSAPSFTTRPYRPDYILSNFGGIKQPAYDIPIRDNSDETTTFKTVTSTKETVKPVFENSEEIYDGEEDIDSSNESDGEVSQESMKVPVITTSNEERNVANVTKTSTEVTEDVFEPPKHADKDRNVELVEFNPGTQTEKPFRSNGSSNTFQSNTIRPVYNHMKPRPFTANTAVLDHQLQQPHWQINQLMINSTNVSYEENLDLNIGEEISAGTTNKPSTTPNGKKYYTEYDHKYRKPQRPVGFTTHGNDSNIITSTVHIKDKKPLIVEDIPEKSTLPPISLTTLDLNRSSSEIIDLSPPPPTMDYSFKPSTNDEMIMGMSPPPPRTQPPIRYPQRTQPTPRPIPIRTPPPYRTKPLRTLPPRLSSTPRPRRPAINRDEVSTYRPVYDILNNVRRPVYNRDQPSSQLLPPPREIPSRVVTPIDELPSPTISVPSVPDVVFPTPISSGWLTSSGVGFSSSFDFAPTSVYFPDVSEPSKIPDSSSENPYSYEVVSSSERFDDVSSEKPITEDRISTSKEISTEPTTKLSSSSEEQDVSDAIASESSHEDTTTDKMKVIPITNKNRTRKPYPVRHDDKKSTTNKYRLPSKPTSIIRPTKTLSRPEILYPTRHISTRKIVRPIPTRTSSTIPTSIIESSESSIDDDFIKPTEVLKESVFSSTLIHETQSKIDKVPASIVTPSLDDVKSILKPTHHAGNEIKISDEVTPTKTEFRTTVVTLTKTLSEPPKTVSSIGYVNLTHTLTVTHTKTSLVSQSEGAVTQTLVLTNTHTSTIVDVVTEIQTQVQPTTIVETVTKHIPVSHVEPTPVQEIPSKTKVPLDDITMSSEEDDNLIIRDNETTENVQKVDTDADGENDTFFVVMNKSQNGGKSPPVSTDIDTGDYDITRNEQVNGNGVSQVLFGEILLAGTPYLETTNVVNPTGIGFGKECQPDCKASRNERCQRIDGMMKCVCRPGFARMFPDRPCKPTYTYSVKLALGSQGNERLHFQDTLADNSSKHYHALAVATHEGINRMVMQSDLRDVFHGVHITGFQPVDIKDTNGDLYKGVMNDFYVQLSDNAHESRLKEVIEKYLRNNNYSLGGTDVHAAGELMDRLNVSDFDECTSGHFHDCSEHAQCFNLRGTYTCSCLEGFADLSVNSLYPGRICSAEPVGCERCNYHGACYSRDDRRVLCECFQWYAGSTCHINLKVVLISLVVLGALLVVVLAICAVVACKRPRPPPRSIVTCIQGMPSLHQGAMPSKQRADRRALISDRGDSGDASSVQNASLPYMPAKSQRASTSKKCVISDPPSHDPPPPPAPAVMIPRARLHPHHSDSRENVARKRSLELSSASEAKLISYLESGGVLNHDEMRRKHSMESSYSANKDRHNKQGALVSAGFKVSTTVRADDTMNDRDDLSSVHKTDLEAELAHFDSLRKSYSQEDLSEWTDAERRIGELTLSEARSVGGTLPASTGRAASSTRLTHQEAHTMAERDLGSTFLLPHVHLYKPDLTSDVSEFDSL